MMFLCSSRVELGLLTKEFRDNLGLAPEDCTVYKTKAAAWEDTSHRPCISGIKYHGTCQCKKNRYQLTWQEGSLRKLHHFSNWHQRKGNALAKLGHFQVLVLPWCSLSLSVLSFFASSKQQLSPTLLTGEHFGWSKLPYQGGRRMASRLHLLCHPTFLPQKNYLPLWPPRLVSRSFYGQRAGCNQ